MKLTPPKHLERESSQFWRDMVSEYGITDAGGLAFITTAAECLDRMRAAQKLIKKHGEVIEDDGQLKSNPANKVELDSRNGFLSAMRMLNLDTEPFKDRPGRPGRGVGWSPHASNGKN